MTKRSASDRPDFKNTDLSIEQCVFGLLQWIRTRKTANKYISRRKYLLRLKIQMAGKMNELSDSMFEIYSFPWHSLYKICKVFKKSDLNRENQKKSKVNLTGFTLH